MVLVAAPDLSSALDWIRRSLSAPVPDLGAVRQRFEPAVLDLQKLRRELAQDDGEVGPGAQWQGRRWSGRRGSARRWWGAKWIDSDD